MLGRSLVGSLPTAPQASRGSSRQLRDHIAQCGGEVGHDRMDARPLTMQTMVANCSLGCEPLKLTGKDVNTFPTDTLKNSATADVMIADTETPATVAKVFAERLKPAIRFSCPFKPPAARRQG